MYFCAFSSRLLVLRSLFFLLILFIFRATAFAERPEAPVILDFGPGGCSSVPEICGDGIDQDCNGSDLPCAPVGPVNDRDADGFAAAEDCDDNNRNVYPGISVACSEGCGSGWKRCQSGGAFSSCQCSPLCEASGGGSCYYISKLNGNDANPGSFAQPWKSFAPIFDYGCQPGATGCNGDAPPSGITQVSLNAGDVVYILAGNYTESWNVEGARYALHLRDIEGTASNRVQIKAYPGANVTIMPAQRANGIMLLYAKHVLFEGIEVARATDNGMFIVESDYIEVRNMWLHDTDGVDNDNLAGLKLLSSTYVDFHHSIVNDNYDRTNADTGGRKTENSRNIVLFRGGYNRIHHNSIFHSQAYTAPKTGSCLVQKHGLSVAGATLEVDHNVFRNCWFTAIGTCSYGSRFHHNLIIDSEESFTFVDHGGPPLFKDNIIEYNTMVNTPGIKLAAKHAYDVGGEVGLTQFRYNIVRDNHTYSNEGALHRIDIYGTPEVQQWFEANADLRIDSNCYYNPNGVSITYYPYANGGHYSFAQWQGRGFDTSGHSVDPALDAYFAPQESRCRSFGHLAGQ